MDDSERDSAVLRTRRVLPHAPGAVYAAFADPARLALWWGPDGFTNTFEVCEFREGGAWKFTMHGPDGAAYRNECVFARLAPAQQVVIRHVTQPLFTLTVTFESVAGGTRLTWEQDFGDPRVAAAVRPIAGPGNEQNLDRLGRLLGGQSV